MEYKVKQSSQNFYDTVCSATAGIVRGAVFALGLAGIVGGCGGGPDVKSNTFESLYATKKVREAETSGKGAVSGEAILSANLLRSRIKSPSATDKVRVANDTANNYFDEALKLTDENPRKSKLAGARAVLDYILTPRDHDSDANTPDQAVLDDASVLASERVAVYDTAADVEFERFKLGVQGASLENVVDFYSKALKAADDNDAVKESLRGYLVDFAEKLDAYLNAKDVAKADVDSQKHARKSKFTTLFMDIFKAVGTDAAKLAEASELWSIILDKSPIANMYANEVANN